LPGESQHGLIRLDCFHPDDLRGIVKGEVLSSSRPNFKHDSLDLSDHFLPPPVELSPDKGLAHYPVVKGGKVRVRDLI
jgi:hypothetical protein